MSEITDLGSPDRDLSARDIKRKKDKLTNVIEKLKNPNLSGRRRHNLEFKKEKTLDQITTGKSGIRPVKQPYEGPSRKSSSPINDLMKDGEAVPSTEGVYRKSALNMLGVKSSPLNDMTEQEKVAFDAEFAALEAANKKAGINTTANLGPIQPSRFTQLKTKLEDSYTDAGKSDEFRNKFGGGEHQDFYYDPNKFAEEGKNYHGIIPGDNTMGMIRSGAIEYPEDMENILEHYKGKNWVSNKK